jgi:hypothetical protein
MSSIVSRFKVLGLCMLALCGLTTLTATRAQANWLENGVEVTVNKSVKAQAHTTGKLVISSLNFEIRCPTLVAENLKIVGSSTKAEGKVKFTGCKGFDQSTGTEQKNCTPETAGGVKETVLAGGLTLIKLLALTKGGTLLNVILFEQKEAEPFTTIKLPALCALGETSSVTGSLVAECGLLSGSPAVFVQEDCKEPGVKHLLQAPPQTEWFQGKEDAEVIKDELKFAGKKAILQGIAAAELESGNSWAGHV